MRSDLNNKDLTDACKDAGTTDATRCLVVADRVFDPAVFSPDLFSFTRKQYLFLNAYRLGVPLEEAAQKADWDPDAAVRFLQKNQTRRWLEDRALKDHIKREWEEPGKWWELGNAVLEGKKKLDKAQTVVFQEFGQRIVPKKETSSPPKTQATINFNFSSESVQKAFERQQSIETTLAEEQDAL